MGIKNKFFSYLENNTITLKVDDKIGLWNGNNGTIVSISSRDKTIKLDSSPIHIHYLNIKTVNGKTINAMLISFK